jgi:hypothetical protein
MCALSHLVLQEIVVPNRLKCLKSLVNGFERHPYRLYVIDILYDTVYWAVGDFGISLQKSLQIY